MKKFSKNILHLLLFASFITLSGVALLSSVFPSEFKKADALEKLSFEGDTITFGAYPQKIRPELSTNSLSSSQYRYDYDAARSEYRTKTYVLRSSDIYSTNVNTATFSNGEPVKKYDDRKYYLFEVQPVKWRYISESNQYYTFITDSIIDSYYQMQKKDMIHRINNYYDLFDSTEKNLIHTVYGSYVRFPTMEEAKVGMSYPTDYAICGELSNARYYYRNDALQTKVYIDAPFWAEDTLDGFKYTVCLNDKAVQGISDTYGQGVRYVINIKKSAFGTSVRQTTINRKNLKITSISLAAGGPTLLALLYLCFNRIIGFDNPLRVVVTTGLIIATMVGLSLLIVNYSSGEIIFDKTITNNLVIENFSKPNINYIEY